MVATPATPAAPAGTPAPTPTVTLAGGEVRPALGLGTWEYGEAGSRHAGEVALLREALALGWRVFDTAEMYADGGAERVLGEALAGALREGGVRREELFVVSKVLPQHATRDGVERACERSLARLRLDQIDLYLLHWRSAVPLTDTLAGFEALQRRGLVRHWGVSNFDVDDMQELAALPGGARCAADQVYASVAERGTEFALRPWLARHGMLTMAHSPLGQGALAGPKAPAVLHSIAARHGGGTTAAQVALAALLAHPGTMAIPRARSLARLRENFGAAALRLGAEDFEALDRAFPPPRRKQPLAVT